jgi:hypothetical protein
MSESCFSHETEHVMERAEVTYLTPAEIVIVGKFKVREGHRGTLDI